MQSMEHDAMPVLIDVGNSFTKIARYDGFLRRLYSFATEDISLWISEIESLKEEDIIVSCVVRNVCDILKYLFPHAIFVSPHVRLPIKFDYDKDALGSDRICNACATASFYGMNAVIVSIGTAVCIDYLKDGTFMGGAIFPGIKLMAEVLNTATRGALPVVEVSRKVEYPGKNTVDSIKTGIFHCVIGAIERLSLPSVSLVLTGGDSVIFKDYLGCIYDPDLTFKGMLVIHELNK